MENNEKNIPTQNPSQALTNPSTAANYKANSKSIMTPTVKKLVIGFILLAIVARIIAGSQALSIIVVIGMITIGIAVIVTARKL